MEQQAPTPWPGRRLEKRVEERGFRPRLAVALIVASWLVGVVVFGIAERLVDPNTFHNVWLGMWWGVQTVTTVGYGDVVPGDAGGKVIAAFLMLGGLALFAVITGAITSAFVAQAQAHRRAATEDPVVTRLEALSAQLNAVKSELDALNRRAN